MRSIAGVSNGERQFLIDVQPGETEVWVLVEYPGDLRVTRWGTVIQEFSNETTGGDFDVQSKSIWYSGVYMKLEPISPNSLGNDIWAYWQYSGLLWTALVY